MRQSEINGFAVTVKTVNTHYKTYGKIDTKV